MTMHVEALTREAFAPFGQVIELAGARHFPINGGSTERFHALAAVELHGGEAIVSVFRAQPRTLPFTLIEMEYHPLGSQAFHPLSGEPYLVVVAPKGPVPQTGDLRVFLARPDQGVNYSAGVWHHPLIGLNAVSDFLIVDRQGPGDNCVVAPLPPTAVVTADDLAKAR
ncbi:MAG: ureidoglycolate lyase [Rhodocyclaceae bacterium]